MIFTEGFQALFKSKKAKEAEEAEEAAQREAAVKLEASAAADYLFGSMLLSQYRKILETTTRFTKLNLRKLGSKLK